MLKNKNPLLLFLYLIDTGGWMHIRPIVILVWLLDLIREKKISKIKTTLMIWGLIVLSIIPSFLMANFQGIEFSKSILYVLPVMVFPFYLIICKKSEITIEDFIKASTYFSFFIIFIYLGLLLDINIFKNLISYLSELPEAGFFDVKDIFLPVNQPAIYFKATLLLVPAGIMSFYKKKYFLSGIFLLALLIAQSRFGVLVFIIFLIFKYITNNKFRIFIIGLVGIVITYLISNDENLALGMTARANHLISIVDFLSGDLKYIIWGSGPGSEFYSSAIDNFTDDTEISQFEILRRYGVIATTILFYVFYRFYINLKKKCSKGEIYGFLAYFIVSASNPVLLTAPAIFYYAILINRVDQK